MFGESRLSRSRKHCLLRQLPVNLNFKVCFTVLLSSFQLSNSSPQVTNMTKYKYSSNGFCMRYLVSILFPCYFRVLTLTSSFGWASPPTYLTSLFTIVICTPETSSGSTFLIADSTNCRLCAYRLTDSLFFDFRFQIIKLETDLTSLNVIFTAFIRVSTVLS